MLLTIFTPTFNRAYTLGRLYESLKKQTNNMFEWVIVDDGSTDSTKEMVAAWKKEMKVPIRYYYQRNSGKPSAHNMGVRKTSGELFCCVDSDDYLREDAVERIIEEWKNNCGDGIIGILAFRYSSEGNPITTIASDVKYSTLRDAYKHHGLKGDTMLVYKTEIIRKYAFPVIEGEKFIPEGFIYNKMDKEGSLWILREGLYICEYLDDGYTANVDKLIFNNYKGYILHLNTRIREVDSVFEKLMDSIRYDAIAIGHSCENIVGNAECKFFSALGYIPGYCLFRKRYLPLVRTPKKRDERAL